MKKKKKQNRFYDNKNRNSKWTEQPVGRPIDFADKYEHGNERNEKYTATTPLSYSEKKRRLEIKQKRKRRALAIVLSVVLICTGYICTDMHMIRSAVPAELLAQGESSGKGNMAELKLDLRSQRIECISMDNSIMLDAVIKEIQKTGYNSITFDAKRNDGTIGYSSSLASIDTYGAISNNSTHTKESIKKLLANDILPVARISCYKDNVVPSQNDDMALKVGNGYYTDDKDNTYLDPNSAATYEYIKDIVQELYSYGVTVFMLNSYTLPADISGSYNDGYKVIADKLHADFGGNIKVLQEVQVTISGKSGNRITNSAIDKEIKHFKKINSHQIYYISTKLDDGRIMQQLMQHSIKNFVIG